MPAFLVELLNTETGHYLPDGSNSMVVFALNAANARNLCAGQFEGDSAAVWAAATVTQIQAADDFSDSRWSFHVQIPATIPIAVQANGGISGVVTVAINDDGSAYEVGDVLTLTGGTFSRVCTLRVTAEVANEITGIEIIDPGEYTVNTGLTGIASTGHTADATFDVTYGTNQYMNFIAEMVGLLNADSQIAAASCSVQATAGAPILTAAAIADALGDLELTVEFRYGGVAIPELLSTIVDEGIAAAVLTVLLDVTPATSVSVPTPLKGV